MSKKSNEVLEKRGSESVLAMNDQSFTNEKWEDFVALIKKEVVPALGCTEPIAVAFAAATAMRYLEKENPIEINLFVSGNMMKNGLGVGVPGTGEKGLLIAAAAGAFGGNPDAQLEVLKTLTPEIANVAKKFVADSKVNIAVKDVPEVLYIECEILTKNNSVSVVIKNRHINVVSIIKNNKTIFEGHSTHLKDNDTTGAFHLLAKNSTVVEIWEFAMNAPMEMIDFINEAAVLNKRISKEGLKGDYGLSVGKNMVKNINKGILKEDLMTLVMSNSAAASDARMAGCNLPVMANSGSGNQGIAVTIPVVTTARYLGIGKEQEIRALLLSHFIAIHIKSHLDSLSPLCAVMAAAMGGSCGMVYLMGGGIAQVGYVIANMIADIAGIICDGAKASCSLKVSSSVSSAVSAALLAIDNIRVRGEDGISDCSVEQVINNLGILVNEGMKETDQTILDIMMNKK